MAAFKQQKVYKEQVVLALDIGTEYVRAVVFEARGRKGQIIGYGEEKQELGNMQAGVIIDIAKVVDNCHVAIEKAEEMAKKKPTQFVMGIAGELVKGETVTIEYERSNPDEKITLSELKNIVHKIQWEVFEQVRKDLAEQTGYSEIDIKLINAAIGGVQIDNQRVSNPIGFLGKNLELDIYNAFAPLVQFGALQTIAAEIGYDLLSVVVQPYALSRCLTLEDGSDFSAIFINLGAGTTDIAVVEEGSLKGTKSFSIGGRTFTKSLAHELVVSYPEAEKVKLAYSRGGLDNNSTRIVREVMQADAETWLTGLKLSLQEMDFKSLPSRVLISGGGALLPEIEASLKGQKWAKNLPFVRYPSFSFLLPKDITSLEDKTRKVRGTDKVMVKALVNLALGLAGEESLIGGILRKVTQAVGA